MAIPPVKLPRQQPHADAVGTTVKRRTLWRAVMFPCDNYTEVTVRRHYGDENRATPSPTKPARTDLGRLSGSSRIPNGMVLSPRSIGHPAGCRQSERPVLWSVTTAYQRMRATA